MSTLQELEKRNKILERRWKVAAVILILFVVTRPVALYIVNHFVHKAADKAAMQATANDYPLIDPARKYIPQTDYLINIQSLRDYLNSLPNKVGDDNISVYYEQLNSGANISVNKNTRFFPESLNKIPMAVLVVKRIEDGTWKWDTELSADPSDLDSGSGNLYKTIGSNKMSVDKLLEALIVDSDNTAFNIFAKQMQQKDYSDFEDEIGLQDVYDEQGKASAKEYSRILGSLYTASFLSREGSQKILDLMAHSTFHDFLSQGIPANVEFSHKYGENDKDFIFADAGIVYVPGRPYMLVVMLKGKDNSPETHKWAADLMKEISQHAYSQSLSMH